MKSFKFWLIIFGLGGSLLSAGALYYFYRGLPDQQIPYPYKFNNEDFPEKKNTSQSHLLILGDRFGQNLKRYDSFLTQHITGQTKSSFKILNLAKEYEGLHRTLRHLKSVETLPKVVIFHGGSEEFYEKKFFLKEQAKIMKNFQKYHDDKIKTVLMAAPILSKFIYQKVVRVPLKEVTKDQFKYNDNLKQRQIGMGYKLFEIELDELIQYVLSRNSHLILMTIPLNLDVLPRKICKNSTTEEIIVLQNRAYSLMGKGDYKLAYKNLLILKRLTPGNALTHFLLGQCLRHLGKVEEARVNLETSTALDCETWRGNAVHNAIIRKLAKKYDISLFDFDDFINANLGNNVLFSDDIFPQDLYYQHALKNLAAKVKKFLEITMSL